MNSTSKTFKLLFGLLLLSNLILIAFLSYFLWNSPDNIHTERIDIKDSTGNNRVVISNADKIPSPIIKGKIYERRITPAGLIFYDKNGDERGGIAISEHEQMNLNAISFDYQNADAIGIYAQDDQKSNYFKAGLTINDKDVSGKPGYNINRINLVTENGNASLVMKDANEVPRLVLKVDSLGTPSIEMYNEGGELKWKQ
ncbi:hypothetical protein [Myroides indicus]|uniref:Uncharacterized protein n=1 Tax=Myroides indicus TaxID=1323422 RepID=A0A4R7F0E5_9FLAO|nr:hypothetical protein [Myroides indicus]TDS56623.1 hypothetical protein C8P70_11959 [Myroides indicus]